MKSYAFLNLNGWPYISGEYVDKTNMQSVDRSLIRNQLIIENGTHSSVVDIVIDNVGEKSIGNRSSYNRFLDLLVQNAPQLRGYLDVVKPGLVIAIDYRIESERTGQFLKAATTQIYTENKAHYIDIGRSRTEDKPHYIDFDSRHMSDNAVLVNFNDSAVRTVTNRVHGSDRMLIRLTRIRLFYVCLKRPVRNLYDDRRKPSKEEREIFIPDRPAGRYDTQYHEYHQPQFSFGHPKAQSDYFTLPPNWWSFNKFYHFEDQGRSLVLHLDEINTPAKIDKTIPSTFNIPAGSFPLNKVFVVNTSYKILFKVSVWKNDLTVVNNTQKIAHLLGVPVGSIRPRPDHDVDGKLNSILGLLSKMERDNRRRDYQIRKLKAALDGELDWQQPEENPEEPDLPEDPEGDNDLLPDPEEGNDNEPGELPDESDSDEEFEEPDDNDPIEP